ncbi:RHS repeat protein [Algoriphagus sp. Y33]|uniref:RHS repeat protein n=1 Tax=Algoriphagus sp. Y33 TaxID=2772483 RepID=UPI00177A7C7D|nr:RHS repeat domain-containing protein [Algoriphagus sp. Y33]
MERITGSSHIKDVMFSYLKKTVSLFFFSMVFFHLYGQENNINLPQIIPPSPSAYQLGEYGQTPVGYFTGSINPEIPIFAYSTSNLSIPISLNHHSDGIKVDQLTSNVGLGWNINSGGVITRVVRGRPDENRTTPIPQNIIGNYESGAAIDYFYNLGAGITAGSQPDYELDVFVYHFQGYSGQFVLDHNKNIVILSPSGLRVDKYENGFLITDTKGIKYYFLNTESSQFRSYGDGHSLWSGQVITGWHLSKVTHPKGDEIYLTYSPINYEYDIGNHQSITVANPTLQNSCAGGSGTGPAFTISPVVTTMSRIAGLKLDSITSNRPSQGRVVFSYRNLPVLNAAYLISDIKYFDASAKIIDGAALTYLTTSNSRTFLTSVTYSDPNKKYSFEYYSPESLPARLSFSQDHWGYYNGKNNNYFFPNPSKIDFKPTGFEMFNIGADKEPDPVYSKYGALKKIIYPTKGYTAFEFEANTYHGTKEVLPPSVNVSLPVETNSSTARTTNSRNLLNITFDQEIELNKDVSVNDYVCSPDAVPPHHVLATVTIENLTTAQTNIFYERGAGGTIALGNSFSFGPNNMHPNAYMSLKKNSSYRISISIDRPCLFGGLSFSYIPGEKQVIPAEILQGGVRISKIVKQATPTDPLETKKVYYGKKETLSQSSGIKGNDPWYFTGRTDRIPCQESLFPCSYVDVNYAVLNSSGVRNLYSSSVLGARYRYVTVSSGDDFQNGAEEYEYYIGQDIEGNNIVGDPIEGTLKVNLGWDDGLQKKVSYFKVRNGGFVPLHEKIDTYIRDSRKNNIVYGFYIRKKFNFICTPEDLGLGRLENLDIMEHKMQQNWFYKTSSTEIQYDGNGEKPFSTITNYYYENPNHLQLTKTTSEDSKGNTLSTKILYAHDISVRTPVEDKLIVQNRVGEPIQTETYQNEVRLSTNRTDYKEWGNGIILPETIRTAVRNSALENRIRYHDYDGSGNPSMVSKEGGSITSYFWGYDKQYTIAKAENTASNQISFTSFETSDKGGWTYSGTPTTIFKTGKKGYNLSSGQVTKTGIAASASSPYRVGFWARRTSGTGNVSVSGQTESLTTTWKWVEKTITSSSLTISGSSVVIDELRLHPADAMMTSYTYEPLVGMTSKTDPRGYTLIYEYDSANRLKTVKNEDGHILEHYEYNYAGN